MIDPNRINYMLKDSLAESGKIIEGVTRNFAIGEKVEIYRAEVIAMLLQLPDPFFDDSGGGWSFLNMCETRDGELWTGMHSSVEELCVLAIALDLGKWVMPKSVWSMLPGGMPYIVFFRKEALSTVEN